ncbi:MAG TPA: hypothetical protein VFG69_17475 [Nannocystaceae bacterium]|nr:hypothetical protein [Nannocystaceae bacterium]
MSRAQKWAWIVSGVVAMSSCGGDKQGSVDIAKALETKKEAPKAETKKDTKAAPPKVDPNAPPWGWEAVMAALTPGTKAVYKRMGTDAKGKKAGGELTYVVRGSSKEGAATSYTIEPDPGTNKASSQIANTPWSQLSPFFAMEKVETSVKGRESVTVPAGTFEASVAELSDFFGNKKTVWMIVDQPGIYAKVVDAGNASDDADKTEITYELVSVQRGE